MEKMLWTTYTYISIICIANTLQEQHEVDTGEHAFAAEDGRLPFDDYEVENVAIINNQLQIPLQFKKSGYWNDRIQRYAFYSLGLGAMDRPHTFIKQISNKSIDLQQSGRWLNLGFFAWMSQSISYKLRLIAKEAEFFIKEPGSLGWSKTVGPKVREGYDPFSGILGEMPLMLTPNGGVHMVNTFFTNGLAAGIMALDSNGIDTNQTSDYYARVANNNLQMVQQQGKFLTRFLLKTFEVLDEQTVKLNRAEKIDIGEILPKHTWVSVKPLMTLADAGLNQLQDGVGIFDIISGEKHLQSVGIITNKLKEYADLIERNLFGLLTAYGNMTNVRTDDLVKRSFTQFDVLTGINMHACNARENFHPGDSHRLHASLYHSSTYQHCRSKSLDNPMRTYWRAGQWIDPNVWQLGNCSHFILQNGSFNFGMENNNRGLFDSLCLQGLYLHANFDLTPKYKCDLHESGVTLDRLCGSCTYGCTRIKSDIRRVPEIRPSFTNHLVTKCHAIPGISLLKITSAIDGSEKNMNLTFKFGNGKQCLTEVMVNGSNENIFPADALGKCFQLQLNESDLKIGTESEFGRRRKYVDIDIVKDDDEATRVSAIEFSVKLRNGDEQFVCDLPPRGIEVSSIQTVMRCFQKNDTFDSRSIFAIQIHPKADANVLVFRLCSGQKDRCCLTSAFYNVQQGQKMMYKGAMLRECDGFQIIDNAYTMHVLIGDESHDGYVSDVIDNVTICNSRYKFIKPMHTCSMDSLERHKDCVIPTKYKVSRLKFGFCDWHLHFKANSSVTVTICSDSHCCKTGPLNKVSGVPTYYFEGSKHLHDCQDFEISTTTLKVYVEISGPDALCLNRLQILSGKKILNCYLPLKEEFWMLTSKKLILLCD